MAEASNGGCVMQRRQRRGQRAPVRRLDGHGLGRRRRDAVQDAGQGFFDGERWGHDANLLSSRPERDSAESRDPGQQTVGPAWSPWVPDIRFANSGMTTTSVWF